MWSIPDGDVVVFDTNVNKTPFPFERELLVRSVMLVPQVFLGLPWEYGREYRPGVIHVPRTLFEMVDEQVGLLLSTSAAYTYELSRRCLADIAALHTSTELLLVAGGPTSGADVDRLLSRLDRAVSYAAFNWLVPKEAISAHFDALLPGGQGATAMLQLMTPTVMPFYYQSELALLNTCLKVFANRGGLGREAHLYANMWGPSYSPTLEPSEWEDPEFVAERIVQRMAELGSAVAVREAIEARLASVQAAVDRRQGLAEGLMARAEAQGPKSLLLTGSFLKLLETVSNEEELRHLEQVKAYGVVRKLYHERGFDYRTATTADLQAVLTGD